MKVISLYHILNCIWLQFYFWFTDTCMDKQQGFICNECGRQYPNKRKDYK
jgi:hypothetical protein